MSRELRALHPVWITAGRRRIIARALRAQRFTFREIAELLQVSPETARKDCR